MRFVESVYSAWGEGACLGLAAIGSRRDLGFCQDLSSSSLVLDFQLILWLWEALICLSREVLHWVSSMPEYRACFWLVCWIPSGRSLKDDEAVVSGLLGLWSPVASLNSGRTRSCDLDSLSPSFRCHAFPFFPFTGLIFRKALPIGGKVATGTEDMQLACVAPCWKRTHQSLRVHSDWPGLASSLSSEPINVARKETTLIGQHVIFWALEVRNGGSFRARVHDWELKRVEIVVQLMEKGRTLNKKKVASY